MIPATHTSFTVESLFSLNISQKQTATTITMQLLYDTVNTADLPETVSLLQYHLPSVLATQCFNDDGYPFHIEVANTEIGHLFEHILLEYLCLHKMAKGAQKATYSGKTHWNWIRDPKGTFYIHLSCGTKDADIFTQALDATITLMKVVLTYKQNTPISLSTNTTKRGLKNGKQSQMHPTQTE